MSQQINTTIRANGGSKEPVEEIKILKKIDNHGKRYRVEISKKIGGEVVSRKVVCLQKTKKDKWKDQFGHPYQFNPAGG